MRAEKRPREGREGRRMGERENVGTERENAETERTMWERRKNVEREKERALQWWAVLSYAPHIW